MAVVGSQRPPLGTIAPGADPVVNSNGDVYIGNLQGELRAFHADGTPYWTRQLNSLHGGIFAAPVIGADGSIYVVSSIHYTDHRDGVANARNDSYLHKFTSGGGWLFAIPFPEQYSASPTIKNRGATTAPPNIWRANGIEVVMVPAVYRGYGGKELHLVAFSTSGDVLADEFVSVNGEITDETRKAFCGFRPLPSLGSGRTFGFPARLFFMAPGSSDHSLQRRPRTCDGRRRPSAPRRGDPARSQRRPAVRHGDGWQAR